MPDPIDRCPACKVLAAQHLGLYGTCEKLQRTREILDVAIAVMEHDGRGSVVKHVREKLEQLDKEMT